MGDRQQPAPSGAIDTDAIEAAVHQILIAIGEDPTREGLVGTPERVGRMFAEIFEGIHRDPADEIDAFFGDEHYQEIVMVRDIPFQTFCEHHMLPFLGRAHVAYIPKGRVTGLSKLARLLEGYCRRRNLARRLRSCVRVECGACGSSETLMWKLAARRV